MLSFHTTFFNGLKKVINMSKSVFSIGLLFTKVFFVIMLNIWGLLCLSFIFLSCLVLVNPTPWERSEILDTMYPCIVSVIITRIVDYRIINEPNKLGKYVTKNIIYIICDIVGYLLIFSIVIYGYVSLFTGTLNIVTYWDKDDIEMKYFSKVYNTILAFLARFSVILIENQHHIFKKMNILDIFYAYISMLTLKEIIDCITM